MEFEPTLSAEMAQVLGAISASEDDAAPVHDDELMLGDGLADSHVVSQELPPRRVAQSYSQFSRQSSSDVVKSHKGPPPLTKKANAAQVTEPFSRQPAVPSQQTLERRRVRRDIIHEGDVLLGKFRIDRVIAEGLIVTAEATHVHLGVRYQVALLSPLGHGFSLAQEHFMRTARAVAQLQSEHVARIVEIGVLESGAPFLVAEMLGSADLAEVIRVRGPLAITDVIDYAIQIAEALAEAHSHGVVHGYLRPGNVRVAEGIDGWPLLKVLGFGTMAQWHLNTNSTRNLGRKAGSSSLAYLSPEQIRAVPDLDARTDIWALGALMHEMLVAWPLFQGETTAALLASIVADTPAPVSSLRQDVPRALESVILRCLSKDRGARYTSLAEWARALQPVASSESQGSIERIVRVMARPASSASAAARAGTGLVHVRSAGSHSKPYPSKPITKSVDTPSFWWIAGAVALIGAVAGIGGAVLATQFMRASSQSVVAADRSVITSSDGTNASREPTSHTEIFRAMPAPSHVIADANPASAVGSACAPSATVLAQPPEKPRVRSAAPMTKQSTSQSASLTGVPRDVRAEKVSQSASPKKSSDLFSDIK